MKIEVVRHATILTIVMELGENGLLNSKILKNLLAVCDLLPITKYLVGKY
ncbi:MAG: hypothetical protein H7296_15165 [Bacteroidia bacterium]|nr:hypothetical protein [Bacteroidia bacterium]